MRDDAKTGNGSRRRPHRIAETTPPRRPHRETTPPGLVADDPTGATVSRRSRRTEAVALP